MRASGTRMAAQALLAFCPPMRHRPTLKRRAQAHGDAVTNLRSWDGWGPFFAPDGFPALGTTVPGMPAWPRADRRVRQSGCARAALEAVFTARCGFGPPGTVPQQRLQGSVGHRRIDLHPLLVVSVPTVSPLPSPQALLTPRGAQGHASFAHVDLQQPFGTIADVNPPPGLLVEGLTPLLHVAPRTRGRTPPAVGDGWRALPITQQRLGRHRPHRPLPPRREPPPDPVRPTPLSEASSCSSIASAHW